jgi:hypothetical protein
VVELSTVDEASLEETVNHWVSSGWAFDGVQFAMRDSSKRPSMAFVFFTRQGPSEARDEGRGRFRSDEEAQRHLHRLVVASDASVDEGFVDAYRRLQELAGDEESEEAVNGIGQPKR